MSKTTLETQIMRLGEKQNIEQLQELINKTNSRELTKALHSKLGRNDGNNFWNYLLQGFDLSNFDAREKRFVCVRSFLDGLLKVELSYKQAYDLITRLCQDLTSFESVQLIEVLEHCMDGMRAGDSKCVSWKDLLPEVLKVLAAQPQLNVNSINMSGAHYRDDIVRNLCTMRWPVAVLTPIADMFKELHLTNTEVVTVLNKFAGTMQELSPMELPALTFQLFSMCSTAAQIIIPIIALDKYFHRFYYKKLFSDMNSNSTDFDSIDSYSDKELREAEETVLHHLNYCTQYKITELQLCVVLRNFQSMPDVVLTPFMLSAIISMTAANREPDAVRLSTTIILPFLRTVIKHNEDERTLADYSVWCRDTLQRKQVDLEQIFTVLIDQNKDGKDVITPGLVNLAFVLLKAKQCLVVNALAINFLAKFIRKRFVFGQGIVKRISEWMIVEQEQNQYSECLTMLSVADTFTVSECQKTINYVMDFFLWLPGEQAMRMMSFILPILKISNAVRDAFIEVLRKAMNSSDVRTRRMSVYGFCMILKQLNNSNSQRTQHSNASGHCTQHSISGFSLMTQSNFGSRTNPQRNFDMLTLEIIGLLRNCFTQSLDIKRTLYDNLQRAVELNAKLVPHVLQFIDWHFRSYFSAPSDDDDAAELLTDSEFSIKYELLVHASDAQHMELEIKDNLGSLIQFVAHCLVIFDQIGTDYDTREMRHLLDVCIERIAAKRLTFEDTTGPATHLKCALLQQQLNLIEGLMAYALLSSKQTNNIIKQLLPLYKTHHYLQEQLQKLASNVKKAANKRGKNPNDNETTTLGNLTVNGVAVKKFNTQAENIWDLEIVERLLRLLHEDIVPFAAAEHTNSLRTNVELVRYVLEIAMEKVQQIRLEPEYKQLAHSKRTLKQLTDITKVVYERCIKRLSSLWRDFDLQTAVYAAQCFTQCLSTANVTYKKRFKDVFVKGFDFYNITKSKESTYIVQDVIDEFMQENDDAIGKHATGRQIPQLLLQSLEVLYDNVTYENRITTDSYTWLLHFCQTYELENNDLGLVHKLLFTQRQKTHSGAFFDGIALLLGKVLGTVSNEDENETPAEKQNLGLKSINLNSAESCLQYLYAALRKQIEDVDYFITKANNLNFKCRIIAEDERAFCRASLDALERAICTQLIHVSRTLQALTNVCIPLGTCMDSLMRLLMQHYACLKNLAKHYLSCCATGNVSIRSSKFDLLLRVVGKPLPTNIYAMIKYIEENILEGSDKKKTNPKVAKAKVLRETKLIPKIILGIENFNKHVILLSKKSHDRLSNLLHFGTVRDFRIKTDDLKAAIERTFSHSSQIEVDESNLQSTVDNDEEDTHEEADDADELTTAHVTAESETFGPLGNNDDEDDVASTASNNGIMPTKKIKRSAKTNTTTGRRTRRATIDAEDDNSNDASSVSINNEDNPTTGTQLLKNLAKINKKAKKRALRESEQNDPDVLCAPAPEPASKRRRGAGRAAKK